MVRGGLIGLAELVPGVSGGTIALVTGVYERVLHQANLFLDATKKLPKDRKTAFAQYKALDWMLLLPMVVGMGAVVLSLAGVMESFVTDKPVHSRALFFGMVLLSLSVPIGMTDKEDARRRLPMAILGLVVAAVATFFLTGVTSAPQSDPNLLWVFVAAAIAVCALVLPGVSGSFFLLAVGLYSATMAAVDDRNLVYLGVFFLGALTGIVCFVRLLEYLLHNHRTITLFVMTGLMLGSLRALWPWQDGDANLQAPGEDLGAAIGLFLLGAVIVVAMLAAEKASNVKTTQADAS
ncbi:DUF368 domain-containing protein [Corynebacterium macclintockiae]|uniref:DUF368 domain-containing protein n=1 Tax=Corynebacterium macclintockiae TaxID=2913501 RepID=UPI00254CF8AD|nr:DUF368 domain-containing protein [Corynebacterium macclintockiae]